MQTLGQPQLHGVLSAACYYPLKYFAKSVQKLNWSTCIRRRVVALARFLEDNHSSRRPMVEMMSQYEACLEDIRRHR